MGPAEVVRGGSVVLVVGLIVVVVVVVVLASNVVLIFTPTMTDSCDHCKFYQTNM